MALGLWNGLTAQRNGVGMRTTLRTVALIIALGLIGYGLWQPIERELIWLICLWLAAPFIGVMIWLSRPDLPRGLSRSLYNLGMVIVTGFLLLSGQLLRQQVIHAEATANYIATANDGSTISNVRAVLASQRIVRGTISDRTGLPLVSSQLIGNYAQRVYPLAAQYDPSAFGNVLGYFSTRYGASGIEAAYAGYLSGAQGDPIGQLRQEWLGEQRQGNDLQLTLNAALQNQAAALLGNRSGSVVVLDPRSGEVLALVSRPGFDPQQLSFNPQAESWAVENERIAAYWSFLNSDSSGQPLINRPTQGQYPPGSIYKTVTAIGVLEAPTIGRPNEIRCENELLAEAGAPPIINAVPDLYLRTGDPSDLERVFAYSCNVAFAQYALRLGVDGMEEIGSRFDIFPPQGAPNLYSGFSDLPTAASRLYVAAGYLRQPRALADTGYGQGQLLVTPLQMAMMASAVANDGIMMRPYLVSEVTRPDGSLIVSQGPRAIRRVMSSETSATMRANMNAVARYGFGSVISEFVPGINVGGKSGTAQHVPGLPPHAWFIAFAPLEEPRYAVAVMLESGGEGSSVAATLAGQVLAAAFATE